MGYRNGNYQGFTTDDWINMAIIFFILIPICLIAFYSRYLLLYIKSRKFHPVTTTPRQPTWLNDYPIENLSKIQYPHFTIYKKCYLTHMRFPQQSKEKSKKIMKQIRKLLENHLQAAVDIPDSTCLIAIPRTNFKCGSIPGEFVALRGGPPGHNYYEYQMIGEDRIQVTYFVAGGERYVAGICIFIENPYQLPIRYRKSIILDLLNSPTYWPKWNLKEQRIEISEGTLLTRSEYGVATQFQYNGERRQFEDFQEPYGYHNFKAQNPNLNLKIETCKFWNTLVMVEEKDGRRTHVSWNKDTKKIEYYKCKSCEAPEDTEPPSYQDCTLPLIV